MVGQVWWHTTLTPAQWRQDRIELCKFVPILVYLLSSRLARATQRLSQKRKNGKNKKEEEEEEESKIPKICYVLLFYPKGHRIARTSHGNLKSPPVMQADLRCGLLPLRKTELLSHSSHTVKQRQ